MPPRVGYRAGIENFCSLVRYRMRVGGTKIFYSEAAAGAAERPCEVPHPRGASLRDEKFYHPLRPWMSLVIDRFKTVHRDVRIDLRRRKVHVAEKLLDAPEIRAPVQQVRRE